MASLSSRQEKGHACTLYSVSLSCDTEEKNTCVRTPCPHTFSPFDCCVHVPLRHSDGEKQTERNGKGQWRREMNRVKESDKVRQSSGKEIYTYGSFTQQSASWASPNQSGWCSVFRTGGSWLLQVIIFHCRERWDIERFKSPRLFSDIWEWVKGLNIQPMCLKWLECYNRAFRCLTP